MARPDTLPQPSELDHDNHCNQHTENQWIRDFALLDHLIQRSMDSYQCKTAVIPALQGFPALTAEASERYVVGYRKEYHDPNPMSTRMV